MESIQIKYRVRYPHLTIYSMFGECERTPRIVLSGDMIEFDGALYEPAVFRVIYEAYDSFMKQPHAKILQAPEEPH